MLYAMLSFDKLSNETHFVGLSFEKAAARRSAHVYARTFASRKVFSPTHMSPEKINKTLFAPAGANSARLFRQTEMRPLFFRGRSILQQHRLELAAFHGRFYCFAEKVKVALE